MKWKPASTAPYNVPVLVYWMNHPGTSPGVAHRITGHWGEELWLDPDDEGLDFVPPTHFMFLPPPPAPPSTAETKE